MRFAFSPGGSTGIALKDRRGLPNFFRRGGLKKICPHETRKHIFEVSALHSDLHGRLLDLDSKIGLIHKELSFYREEGLDGSRFEAALRKATALREALVHEHGRNGSPTRFIVKQDPTHVSGGRVQGKPERERKSISSPSPRPSSVFDEYRIFEDALTALDSRIVLVASEREYYKKEQLDTTRLDEGLQYLLAERSALKLRLRELQSRIEEHSAKSMDVAKKEAARRCIDKYVKDGMIIGLGGGSMMALAIEHLGRRLKDGSLRNVSAVSNSGKTTAQAQALGIPLVELDRNTSLDVAFDGADEVHSGSLALVKGRGFCAVVRDRMIFAAARKVVLIADESKLVSKLCSTGTLACEVLPFWWERTAALIQERLGVPCSVDAAQGADGKPMITDNGNVVLAVKFETPLESQEVAADIASKLNSTPGLVDHGLFLEEATAVALAMKNGARPFEMYRVPNGTILGSEL